MRRLIILLMTWLAVPQAAAAQSYPAPLFNPAEDYVTAGQDEPGYKRWYAAAAWRPTYVRAFHNYLVNNGVAGVAPTWHRRRDSRASGYGATGGGVTLVQSSIR